MPYCTNADLLVGDLTVSDPTRTAFVQRGADEMDQELAKIYVLPLTPIPPAIALSASGLLALKRCNYLISSGRLLIDRGGAALDEHLQAYGASLLQEGQMLLYQIVSGNVILGAVTIATEDTTGNAPSIINFDATSGVDAYYEFVGHRSGDLSPPTLGWRPGA